MESKAFVAMAQVANKTDMGTIIRVHDSPGCMSLQLLKRIFLLTFLCTFSAVPMVYFFDKAFIAASLMTV